MSNYAPAMLPSLLPKQVDPTWFPVPKDIEEHSVTQAEDAYSNWLHSIRCQGNNLIPIGKFADDRYEDREEMDSESGSGNTSEDDLDTEVLDDQESLPDDSDMNGGNNNDSDYINPLQAPVIV